MPNARLHVICGGGTGGLLLRRLHERGYRLSAGPLSELDDDARTGHALGIELALVAKGGGPAADPLARARALLSGSDGVILTPFAVGTGNLTSLSLPLEFAPPTRLFLVLGGEFARRDYTGGEATKLYGLLRDRATAVVRGVAELLPVLTDRYPIA